MQRVLTPDRQLGPGAWLLPGDALEQLARLPEHSVHAVVTDPPYGLEYEAVDHDKLKGGRGGVWRIPPTLNGVRRRPVPRFSVLTARDHARLGAFFTEVAAALLRVLVPGGHVMIASNPLVSGTTFSAFVAAGFDNRGAIIRLVQTLRGGDRPKGAHQEFSDVSVLPRAAWEPWGLFRKPMPGTVAANLRRWGTGGLRRVGPDAPFRDVIASSPTPRRERALADHPSLKPQALLRQLVRASLPLGQGLVLDPFAGSASTLAAAAAVGYRSLGIERDPDYLALARQAFPALRDLELR